ncbi:MAG: PilT/PilU family type 4a pilus ATPase [Clostridia bacterium]
MELDVILEKTLALGGSDVFIIPGSPIVAKVNGQLIKITQERVLPPDTERLIRQTYEQALGRDIENLLENGDDDFSFSLKRKGRFRCNAYRQRGSLAAILRVVTFGLPNPEKLFIPEVVMNLASYRSGMILVTGSAGSGKTTTLACLVDRINTTRMGHIITIEDPIEYLHPHAMSMVSQREIHTDASSFESALRASLRQAPDVIMLGEMRDSETIQTAITAGETGHLILSSLHTVGAATTVDRIIDAFPANQQPQVRVQLSMVLRAVVSQHLLPTLDGGLRPAFEVMTVNSAIQSMIRDGKTHQMDNVIYGGSTQGMMAMDTELARLYREKVISRETALTYAGNPETLARKL